MPDSYLQESWDSLKRIPKELTANLADLVKRYGPAAAELGAGMLPGAGQAQAWQDYGEAGKQLQEGNYLGAAANYGQGAFNQAFDVLPYTAAMPTLAIASKSGRRAPKAGDRLVGPGGVDLTVPSRAVAEAGTQDTLRSLASRYEPRQQVGGTVGKATDDVKFEGVSPHEFTPGQWGRFGEHYGATNLGPKTDEEFAQSLVPYKTISGRDYTIPGGVESDKPFTYYDMLHMKSQAIDPNDLDPAIHQRIHDRNIAAMQPGPEGASDVTRFNGLTMGMISPNQPLTPNELAQARVMAKTPEDINDIAGSIPWDYRDQSFAKDVVGTTMKKNKKTGLMEEKPVTLRDQVGADFRAATGINAGSQGGLGVSGNADYTRIAEMAQMYGDKPEFFKFKGAAEGGANEAEQWSNYIERLTNQVPGLSAKTGSFGSVWQEPATAATSAIDRHMARKFTTEMFPTKEEADIFKADTLAKYQKENPGTNVDWDSMPKGAKDDAMFGYLNAHPEMVLYEKSGGYNPRVPENLRRDDWVMEPKKVNVISEPYKRTLAANAEEAAKVGQGVFSNQWLLWDRIRNRLEPHEIMHPDLQKLPRMSMDQMRNVRQTYKDAGYLAGPGEKPNVKPFSPSRGAYFALPAAGLGYGAYLQQDDEEQPPMKLRVGGPRS